MLLKDDSRAVRRVAAQAVAELASVEPAAVGDDALALIGRCFGREASVTVLLALLDVVDVCRAMRLLPILRAEAASMHPAVRARAEEVIAALSSAPMGRSGEAPRDTHERGAQVLTAFVLPYLVVYYGLTLVMLVGSVLETRRLRRIPPDVAAAAARGSGELPGVSILVPAYNEASGIVRTIESLLSVDYPSFEVIVVDDGSNDETLDCCSARSI